MLAIVAGALAANMLVQGLAVSIIPGKNTLLYLLVTCGLAEYAFGRHVLPLRLWRAVVPPYVFTVAYLLGAVVARGGRGADGHQFNIVIMTSALIFFGASVVALARRARYLGHDRIPFGGIRAPAPACHNA